MKFLRRLLRVLSAGYILGCVGLYFFQEKLLFHPVPLPDDYDYSFDQPFTEFWLEVPGARLNGLWFTASGPAKGLVLYCHGNAGNLARWGHAAAPLLAQGYDVAIWDYRTFGKSTGPLSEAHLLADSD
ncbi:MAG: alpha/beta hydrolase, partial [Bernardetiaceae bacterium]|nr:alpha/beta hydrolase [Bernardetiaceae bacterium]